MGIRNNIPLMMLPALCLIPLVALLRVLLGWHAGVGSSWLVGATPLSAVALCAGVYLPRRWSLLIPLGILLLSDAVIDAHWGASFFTGAMFTRYLLLAGIGTFGMGLRSQPRLVRPLTVLLGAVMCSTLFYIVSNTFSWLGSASYPQTFAGLVQALTVGLPGYLPAYYFYRNALVSDLLYTIVFVACVERSLSWGKQAFRKAQGADAVDVAVVG
jgi:hypothetical protein